MEHLPMRVRPARAGELATAMTVFDTGGLEIDAERVRAGLSDDRLLVAVEGGQVLGTLLLVAGTNPGTAEIEAVAVRRARRGQGVGTALVGAAADRYDRLVAGFDGRVRPFWASQGFDIEVGSEPGRYVGQLDDDSAGE